MGIKQELPDGLDLCSCAEPPAEAAGHAGHGAVTLSWLHNDHQAQLMLWHQGLSGDLDMAVSALHEKQLK